MDLHSGEPIWQFLDQAPLTFAPLVDSLSCDVAIIGGGITGALLAHQLTAEGHDVVLVDKRTPGVGSTLASTGLLQYALDKPLSELIRCIGQDRAVRAYKRSASAIDELAQLTASLPDDCGFCRNPSYYLASRWWHVPALRREFENLKECGFAVELLMRRQLKRQGIHGIHAAIRSESDGRVDPFRLTQSLLRVAAGRKLRAYSNTQVTRFDECRTGVTLHTDTSLAIRCRYAVIATGYEASTLARIQGIDLQSTYVAVSKPLVDDNRWPDQALFWETARPYFYARRLQDGRAIIGGADTAFHDDHERHGLMLRQVDRLLIRFHQLFPDLKFEVDRVWAGTFAETATSLPFIGRLDGHRRTYVALGYGGNGITFSVIASQLLADLIAGRPNADEDLFVPPVSKRAAAS